MGKKSIVPLPTGTKISHYKLQRVLGGGGFSIVYLAEDLKTHEEVVVKEYFPAKLAERGENFTVKEKDSETAHLFKMGRRLFFQEASILAAISHPNVVQILDFSQNNGTVYTVMCYSRGMSLQAYLRRKGGRMSEPMIKQIFIPLLDALQEVHNQGLLHLDIKPGNIYLRQKLGPLLLDFGAVHKVLSAAPPRMFPVVTHGFSPPEQSIKSATLGPSADLYAVGASMRSCIDGKPPISAKERHKGKKLMPASMTHAGDYSELLLQVIDWCMEMKPKGRPQSAQEALSVLRDGVLPSGDKQRRRA